MSGLAGRICPLCYRYGATAIANRAEQQADTLYVIGGLYGNQPALAAIADMALRESAPVTLCFNGDFNWFNVDDRGFAAINQTVLAHDACLGNVEAELLVAGDEAGCGCAYPPSVAAGVVERSNAIHARLKQTARHHGDILAHLAMLPMLRRYRIGAIAVGVVHGDAESLAGWGFAVSALDAAENRCWIEDAFRLADVDVFASTHTCLPAIRRFTTQGQERLVVNNGAAGMPNFRGNLAGLVTRIAITSSPHEVLYGHRCGGVHIDALAVRYDQARWKAQFLANWPTGSPAHTSYVDRIAHGPDFAIEQAWPGPAGLAQR